MTQTEPLPSPLIEASPRSLDEIFSSDPLGLTNQELSVVVAELRKQALNWAAAEAAGKRSAPKTKTPVAANVSLDDLGL
jgi:hypothetical protein